MWGEAFSRFGILRQMWQIPNDSKFCQFCGRQIQLSTSATVAAFLNVDNPDMFSYPLKVKDYTAAWWLRSTQKKTMLDIVPKGLNYEEALASGKIGEIQKDAALSFSPTVTVRPVIRIAIK